MAHFDPARLFNLAHPIIQAPMAGVSTPDLAAAVSNTGGLGSIGIGASTAAAAQRMIEETRARTSGLFNVNVFCHAPAWTVSEHFMQSVIVRFLTSDV
jgi:nitronate monooxygenase